MISVSNAWKSNQNSQLRAESNVKITFYEVDNYKVVSTLGTVDKKQLKSFSYSESGSIIVDKVYSADITFSLLKGDGTYDFPVGSLIKIEFGYLLNNSWEYIDRGIYEVIDKKSKQNSLTIDYVANHINYALMQRKYTLGSPVYETYRTVPYLVFYSITRLLTNNKTKTNYNRGGFQLVLIGTENNIKSSSDYNYELSIACPICSYSELLQIIFQKVGSPYRITGTFNANNEYFTNANYMDYGLLLSMASTDYAISNFNLIQFPEITYSKKYGKIDYYAFGSGGGTNTMTFTNVNSGGTLVINQDYLYPETFRGSSYDSSSVGKRCFTGGFIPEYNPPTWSFTVNSFYPIEKFESSYDATGGSGITEKMKLANPLTESISGHIHYALQFDLFMVQALVNKNEVYNFNLRIDPRLELYDKITFGNNDLIVENYTIQYNGAFKGTITARKVN